MDGTKRKALALAFVALAFLTGFVTAQQLYSSRITYRINADVTVSLQSPLDLGSLQSPSNGSKLFSEALTVKAYKEGYITLTFRIPQSNLTKLVNQFNVFRISIRNSGGEYAYVDLQHPTDNYSLAVPQTWYAHILIEWSIKEGVEDPNGVAFLELEVS